MATGVVLALFSRALQDRSIVSEPVIALGAGVLAGPFVLDIISLERMSGQPLRLLEELVRLTLSVAILQGSLRVGAGWMFRFRRDLFLVLVLGLLLMWGLSTLALGANLSVPLGTAILIAAGTAGLWSEIVWLVGWEILAAVAAGGAIGLGVGILLQKFGSNWSTHAGIVAVSVTMAFATLGAAHLAQMDGLFAVFGVAVGLSATVPTDAEIKEEGFSHTLERLFYLPMLVLLGTALPLDHWVAAGWPLLAAVVLLLTIRRIPMILLIRPGLRSVRSGAEALFAGWFGPIGFAAIFYAVLAQRQSGETMLFDIVSAAVAASVVASGLTDTLGARWLGRAGRSSPPDGRG